MSTKRVLQVRLAALSFLEFGVWGAYLISLGNYLGSVGLATHIGWFYAVQGIVCAVYAGRGGHYRRPLDSGPAHA